MARRKSTEQSVVIEALGLLAGVLTTGSFVPQVWRPWRTGSARDISWLWLAAFATGIACWLIYAIITGSLALTLTQIATLALLLLLAVVKVRADRRLRISDDLRRARS